MPGDRLSATGYNFEANDYTYTPVKVRDKDTGKTFVIQMVNAQIKGNKAKWTVKDGKVYDAQGNAIKDNVLEVTKYQAQILKAAAAAGENANSERLNDYDLVGGAFNEKAEKMLQSAKSDFHVTDAEALEHGKIYADVKNKKGETGHLEITFLKDPPPQKDESSFSWWKPWTWF